MSTDIQSAKAVVAAYLGALDRAASGAETAQACARYLAEDHAYRGVHPFNDIHGGAAVAEQVWNPLRSAMPVLQRRADVFLSGHHDMATDGDIWVVEMGHLLGDFTAPWLNIPPTCKTAFVPYVSWYRVSGNRIAETVEFFDILSVITQAGLNPYIATQTAAYLMAPGPRMHDGMLEEPQDPETSARTYELTSAMLTELAETLTSPPDHMARWWHADMNWHGPAGIGNCIGFEGYRRGHTGPFEERLDFIHYTPEDAAIAEGTYCAFLWRPSLGMRNTDGYMGVPANENVAEMRIVDVYRREGDKLAENWIFIDMLHFLKMQGVDLLEEIGAST